VSFLHYAIQTNEEEFAKYVDLFGNKHYYYQNRQRFRVDISEVDFSYFDVSCPKWFQLPSGIVQYKKIRKE
jgi:hypothetical protein